MRRKDEIKVSRRRFLEAAVVTAAAAKSVGAETVGAETAESEQHTQVDAGRLEKLIETYGSEFGDLRKVT